MKIYFRAVSNKYLTGVEGYMEIKDDIDEIKYIYYDENGKESTQPTLIHYEADMNRLNEDQLMALDEFYHHYHEQESWITETLLNYKPCSQEDVLTQGEITLLIDDIDE